MQTQLLAVQTSQLVSQTEQLEKRDEKIAELTDKVSELLLHMQQNPATQTDQIKSKEGGDGELARFDIPKGASLFQRGDDERWVARIMRNGRQYTVACRHNKQYVYEQLMKAFREMKKHRAKKEKDLTLFAWLDHWHTVFRKPKEGTELSKNTIIMDLSMIRKIKEVFKDRKLKDLTADYIQERLYSMTQGRTCEGVYTVLKLALAKAKDRTGGISIMDMVEKVKHERQRGRALNKDEVDKILDAAASETERDIIKFYIYTGCRVDEINATKVSYVNLSNEPRIITGLKSAKGKPIPDMVLQPNEILIYGTKTKLSIRAMPIMPPLKSVLEKWIKDREPQENLFGYTLPMIRYFYRKIKAITGIDFTLKDFRHTCATNFKDAGIPSGVYFRWFGWSDDTMAKKVYTHVTDYEQKVSQEWAAKFESEDEAS